MPFNPFSYFSRSNPPQASQAPIIAWVTSEKPQLLGTHTTVKPGTPLIITREKGEYRKTFDGYKFGVVLNQSPFQTVTFVGMEMIDKGERYSNAQRGNRGRYDIFYTVKTESGNIMTFKENDYVFVTYKTTVVDGGGKYKSTRKAMRKNTRKVTHKATRKVTRKATRKVTRKATRKA
jgi:hypothetical protein